MTEYCSDLAAGGNAEWAFGWNATTASESYKPMPSLACTKDYELQNS